LWGNILTSAKVKGVILSVLHHPSLCIKQTASTTSQQISKAEDHQVLRKMSASMPKEEPRPKTGNEDREITIRKKSSGLSRLLLAISITLLAFVILLQPSTVNLDTALSHDGESKTALILTAHPDDEVMFFTPTILALATAGWEVGGLCLSNGQWFIMVQRGS
jgi:hypothetical protein